MFSAVELKASVVIQVSSTDCCVNHVVLVSFEVHTSSNDFAMLMQYTICSIAILSRKTLLKGSQKFGGQIGSKTNGNLIDRWQIPEKSVM